MNEELTLLYLKRIIVSCFFQKRFWLRTALKIMTYEKVIEGNKN